MSDSALGRASNFRGPHEGRELELLASGAKPLAMFVEPLPAEYEFFDEQKFDAMVERRALVKDVRIEPIAMPDGGHGRVRRVLYARPLEAWRIPAMLFIHDVYGLRGNGFSPDLERVIGMLLGYERKHIESYIADITARLNEL